MDFFAGVGCDHVMVDAPDSPDFKARYAAIGAAIANSSNPNMLYGVWNGGFGHAWKWAAEVGGHYWRMGTDTYDGWTSVMRQARQSPLPSSNPSQISSTCSSLPLVFDCSDVAC